MVAAARKYNAWCRWARKAARSPTRCARCELLQRGSDRAGVSCARALLPPPLFDRPHAGRAGSRRPRLGSVPGARAVEAVQQEQIRLQLALVLGYRQRRYRQPGRARNGHRLWGLGRAGWPQFGHVDRRQVVIWKDDQETPNTQQTVFNFGDAQMTFDVRNLPTPPEGLVPMRGPNYVGNIFFGDWIYGRGSGRLPGLQEHGEGGSRQDGASPPRAGSRSTKRQWTRRRPRTMTTRPSAHEELSRRGPLARLQAAARRDRDRRAGGGVLPSGEYRYRTARTLHLNQSTGDFIGNDEANAMRTRNYREPYVVPAQV